LRRDDGRSVQAVAAVLRAARIGLEIRIVVARRRHIEHSLPPFVFGRSHQPSRQFQAGFIACFDLTPRRGIDSTELDDAISPEAVSSGPAAPLSQVLR
jgi:hypothetical protein